MTGQPKTAEGSRGRRGAELFRLVGREEPLRWPELLKEPRVVLLSEAGSGKTEEIRHVCRDLRERKSHAFFLRIEHLVKDFEASFEEGTLAENLPTVEIARADMQSLGVLAAFVRAGLVSSNGEARRQIKGGGLKVNDTTVTDEKMVLTAATLTPEGVIKLSLGKKRHVLLKPA